METENHPSIENTSFLPPHLPALTEDIKDLRAILKRGQIAKFDFRPYYKGEVLDWSLDHWTKTYGNCRVNLHSYKPEAVKLMLANRRNPQGQVHPILAKNYKRRGFWVGTLYEKRGISISSVVKAMRAFKDVPLETEWHTDETKNRLQKMGAYGAINTRLLPGFEFNFPEFFDDWAGMYNFLWFGLSGGALHHDCFDNTLIQLHGKKSVLIYSPDLTSVIEGGQTPVEFDPSKPLSPLTLTKHKYLKYLPYTRVDLNPGEGVTIPAYAYHGAAATTYDSISLNSFLIAHTFRGPWPYKQMPGYKLPHAKGRISRLVYNLTGYVIPDSGPYDFI